MFVAPQLKRYIAKPPFSFFLHTKDIEAARALLQVCETNMPNDLSVFQSNLSKGTLGHIVKKIEKIPKYKKIIEDSLPHSLVDAGRVLV